MKPITTDNYAIHLDRFTDLYVLTTADGFPWGSFESLAEALHYATTELTPCFDS